MRALPHICSKTQPKTLQTRGKFLTFGGFEVVLRSKLERIISHLEGLRLRSAPNAGKVSHVWSVDTTFALQTRGMLRSGRSFAQLTQRAARVTINSQHSLLAQISYCARTASHRITRYRAATYSAHCATPPANAVRAHKSHRASYATKSQPSSPTPQTSKS